MMTTLTPCGAPGCTGLHSGRTTTCKDEGLLALSLDGSREQAGTFGFPGGLTLAELTKVYVTEVVAEDSLGELPVPIQPGFYLVWRLDNQPVKTTEYPDRATADAAFAEYVQRENQ